MFERQLYTLNSWNIISVVKAIVRAWVSSADVRSVALREQREQPAGIVGIEHGERSDHHHRADARRGATSPRW